MPLSDLSLFALKAGPVAEDLVEQILRLYSPEAIGGKADGIMSAEILMGVFETAKNATVLPTKLRKAALAVITPELLAALPSEAQTSLAIVSTFLSNSPCFSRHSLPTIAAVPAHMAWLH